MPVHTMLSVPAPSAPQQATRRRALVMHTGSPAPDTGYFTDKFGQTRLVPLNTVWNRGQHPKRGLACGRLRMQCSAATTGASRCYTDSKRLRNGPFLLTLLQKLPRLACVQLCVSTQPSLHRSSAVAARITGAAPRLVARQTACGVTCGLCWARNTYHAFGTGWLEPGVVFSSARCLLCNVDC